MTLKDILKNPDHKILFLDYAKSDSLTSLKVFNKINNLVYKINV